LFAFAEPVRREGDSAFLPAEQRGVFRGPVPGAQVVQRDLFPVVVVGQLGQGGKIQRHDERRARFVSYFGEERWAFEAAGWGLVGVNAQLFGSNGQAAEAELWTWLDNALGGFSAQPIALFLHKPLFLDTPQDPEEPHTAIRYVPQPVRARLVEMLGQYDVRLVASGHVHQRRDFTYGRTRHVWVPSVGFTMPERIQPGMGFKETGIVEYSFRPDSFEVRHIRAAGQLDIDLDGLIAPKEGSTR